MGNTLKKSKKEGEKRIESTVDVNMSSTNNTFIDDGVDNVVDDVPCDVGDNVVDNVVNDVVDDVPFDVVDNVAENVVDDVVGDVVEDAQNSNAQTEQQDQDCHQWQCKPDLSCWSLFPPVFHQKWTRLKNWFWRDMMKTHLIWIKMIFFFQSGSLVVLYPYLVIHMRSLGLSVEEVALVNGVIPVADIVGPPLAGFVADKIGNFRVFMSVMTGISGLASLLLMIIPPKISSKISDQGDFVETLDCCNFEFCYGDELDRSSIFSIENLNSTDLAGVCSMSNGSQFGLREFKFNAAYNNSSRASFDKCENFTCSFPQNTNQDEWLVARSDWSQILIFYTILRCLIDVLRASSIMMFEGAVVVTIKQLGGDYGLQKLFGTFGAIIWGPISGKIIDMASQASGEENYQPIFYSFCAMRIICALLILNLNLSFKKPAKKVFKNLWKLIIKPHIFLFLVVFFICGSIWGFLEAYLFWFLEDLGSTKFTMGISLAIGTIAGIPLTIASGAIIKKIGNCYVIVLALGLYSLRLLGYSFIETPFQSLFFEVLKPFGNSLLLIAAMTYAKNNADIETMASLEGVMGALYFGVGKATGSLVGGLVIEDIGVRNTFTCFSVLSLVTASVYFCFSFVMGKRKSQNESSQDVEADQSEQSAESHDQETNQTELRDEPRKLSVSKDIKQEDEDEKETRCT